MTKKPQDRTSSGKSSENATAVDYVRTKQEVDAAAEKRQAEAELARTGQNKRETAPPVKVASKQDSDEELDTQRDLPDEPIVEDEP